ncbi:hypothetical protein RB195_021244 [Necator americanus]|uniref:Altered inheritance of mitochondria protein 24, mitochondrial n=1 Tax=Necator americanus TaxID=51031 RepID=A0ABR1EA29_NECAM
MSTFDQISEIGGSGDHAAPYPPRPLASVSAPPLSSLSLSPPSELPLPSPRPSTTPPVLQTRKPGLMGPVPPLLPRVVPPLPYGIPLPAPHLLPVLHPHLVPRPSYAMPPPMIPRAPIMPPPPPRPLVPPLLPLLPPPPHFLSPPTFCLPVLPPNMRRLPSQFGTSPPPRIGTLPSPQLAPSPPTSMSPAPQLPPSFVNNLRPANPNSMEPMSWNVNPNSREFGSHSAMWSSAALARPVWAQQPSQMNIPNDQQVREQNPEDDDYPDDESDSDIESELEPGEDAAPIPVSFFPNEVRSYPSLQANFKGSYFIMLANTVTIEMSVDRCMRLTFGKVSVFISGDGTTTSIAHKNMYMVQNGPHLAAKFTVSSVTDQHVMITEGGVLITASNLDNAFLVSDRLGVCFIPLNSLDFTLGQLNGQICKKYFEEFATVGVQYYDQVEEIVGAARYYKKRPWKSNIYVQGVFVRYVDHGEVVYRYTPYSVHYNRRSGCLSLKTPRIEVSIKEGSKVEIKFGTRRVHVSNMGIVVSDNARSASLDLFGRLVSV